MSIWFHTWEVSSYTQGQAILDPEHDTMVPRDGARQGDWLAGHHHQILGFLGEPGSYSWKGQETRWQIRPSAALGQPGKTESSQTPPHPAPEVPLAPPVSSVAPCTSWHTCTQHPNSPPLAGGRLRCGAERDTETEMRWHLSGLPDNTMSLPHVVH